MIIHKGHRPAPIQKIFTIQNKMKSKKEGKCLSCSNCHLFLFISELMEIFTKLCDSMNDTPRFRINYEENGCTLTCTWPKVENLQHLNDFNSLATISTQTQTETAHSFVPTKNFGVRQEAFRTVPPITPQIRTAQPFVSPLNNTFYHSNPFQRLIAMQHLLNRTR